MREDSPLINVAMQIILHAGDARNHIEKALDHASAAEFKLAEEFLVKAQDEINEAHKAQVDVIQAEMSGEEIEYCALFSHAQDTLMTIMSELHVAKRLLDLYKKVTK